jgi:hypothetical protein
VLCVLDAIVALCFCHCSFFCDCTRTTTRGASQGKANEREEKDAEELRGSKILHSSVPVIALSPFGGGLVKSVANCK